MKIPLLSSIQDGVARSVNDLDIPYWFPGCFPPSGLRFTEEGRTTIKTDLTSTVDPDAVYMIFRVPLSRASLYAKRNRAIHVLTCQSATVKGNLLVVKCSRQGDVLDLTEHDAIVVDLIVLQ